MTTLSERALLVSLNISVWSGRKLDKSETAVVVSRNNASKNAARVNKALLPEAAALHKITTATGAIRTFVYKRTAPWGDGVQIMQSSGYLDFMQEYQKLRGDWERAVDDFLFEYPSLKVRAQNSLGSLFDPNDYPDVDDLRRRFKLDMRFLPVPNANDWRVDLGDELVEDLKRGVEEQVRAAQDAAMQSVFERIYKMAENAHARLKDPKSRFHDTLVSNAVELCEILPTLNITGDKRVESLRKVLQTTLGKHNPDTLRKDPLVRKQTADAMKKVMDKMSGFYAPAA